MMGGMALGDIRDQEVPVRFLRSILHQDRIPNGLLFYGPSGVGKGLAAVAFAKMLMCPQHEDADHPHAVAARKIDHGNHPDLHTVAPVKKSRIIDVEAIDGIIELASLRPMEAPWRVFILHEADRMRGPAQNHLLKTLEEPLGRSVFILVTEYPQLLLPTIRSRCQRVRFGRLRPETVRAILQEERDLDADEAETIAGLAQGQMTRAFDLVDSDKRDIILDIVQRLQEGNDPLALSEEFAGYVASQRHALEAAMKAAAEPDEVAERSKDDREQIKAEQAAVLDAQARRDILELLYLLEMWYRDVLVYSATGDAELVLNQDQKALLESSGGSGLEDKLAAVEKARLYLERFITEERVFRDLFFALAG